MLELEPAGMAGEALSPLTLYLGAPAAEEAGDTAGLEEQVALQHHLMAQAEAVEVDTVEKVEMDILKVEAEEEATEAKEELAEKKEAGDTAGTAALDTGLAEAAEVEAETGPEAAEVEAEVMELTRLAPHSLKEIRDALF